MAASTMASLLLVALLPASCVAAVAPSPIAYWTDPNAAVIRDAIYISGGDRFTNTSSGTAYSGPTQYVPAQGALYNISLCKSFSTADNNIDFLVEQPQYPAASDPAWYVGGAMLATDDSFYTYGSVLCFHDPTKLT